MLIVIWKKNGMRLRVLDIYEGRLGEMRYAVCKISGDPIMGRFSIRADEVDPI
jgi:hypothetical protein